jgi:cytochrome d ubiquinol oxidase subunit II
MSPKGVEDMLLPLLSASFLVFALTLYMLLDGFDLGVGILLLFQPETAYRDHMVDSITPTWDGNETWIIMTGVTLLAAFPIAYSILLSAFYLPVIIGLLALGFRGVSFEFRVQSKQHRRAWDIAFALGSLVAAFMQGLILGGLTQGVTVQNQRFAGSVLDVFRPLPIISGMTVVIGYAVLGGGWLKLKSSVLLQNFANRALRVFVPAFAVLFGIASFYAAEIQPSVRSQWSSHGIALPCLVGLFAFASVALMALSGKSRPALPFLLGLLLFIVGISEIALILFPNLVPFSVSLWDAASSPTSQQFVLIGAACVTPGSSAARRLRRVGEHDHLATPTLVVLCDLHFVAGCVCSSGYAYSSRIAMGELIRL